MTDVFLSYSRKNTGIMQKVRDDLRSAGLIVWTDEALEPGTPAWHSEIGEAIENCRTLAVLLSPDAKQSKWVGKEISYAESHEVRIFPVLAQGEEKDAIPFNLNDVQRVDIRFSYDMGIQTLIDALKKFLGVAGKSPRFLTGILDRRVEDGWQEKYFGDLVEIFDKYRIQISENARHSGSYPYYGAAGIIDYIDTYAFEGEYLLITATSSNLLSRSHPIAFKANGKFSVNSSAHVIQPKPGVSLEYLMYFLQVTDIRDYVVGSVIPHLNKTELISIPIILPSYEEQIRIATQIEQQLLALEKQRKSLQAQLRLIDERPKDILYRAFLGEI